MELVTQKHFGPKRMLVMLAFLSAFTAMTTDIYLPALPQMVDALATTRTQVNLSLSLFFIAFAFGLLLWGPLSEKYGRKKILLIGLSLYIFSSIICAFTENINQLIAARVFQAVGASAATAIATALVKDTYGNGSQRARVLAIIMSMVIIAPIIAPVVGAQLLKLASWRAIFLGLSVFGAVGFISSIFLTETVTEKSQLSVAKSLLRPIALLKIPRISISLLLFSSVTMPLMGFLAAASYIYSNDFNMSEEQFSFFFSFNAMCAFLGPVIYIRASKYFSTHSIVNAGFLGLGLSGIALLLVGHISPYPFAACMSIATVFIIGLRPAGVNLILEQHDSDTGSLSSLINFSGTVIGSFGMMIISMEGLDQIYGLSIFMMVVGFAGMFAWMFIRRANIIRYNG